MKLLKLAFLLGFVGLVTCINTYAQQPISWYGIIPGTTSQRISNTATSLKRHDDPAPPAWTNTYYAMAGFNTLWYGGNLTKPAYKEFYLADNNDPRYGKMNFRLLAPVAYNANDSYKYPIIVMCHGAGERANCWGGSCYVSYSGGNISSYNVTYWNNDHNLLHGGQPHLTAVYLANGKKAEDPTLPARAFPGFVLFAQMENGWNPTEHEKLEIIIQKLMIQYKIDPNRVYIHGLSDGGAATWDMLKRKPSLYAAALPMSATASHSSFTPEVTAKLAEIPVWIFQGGKDTGPAPYDTYQLMEKLKLGGNVPRYKVYPNLGHGVWNDAYNEPDFFTWILSKNKSDITVYYGDATTCATNGAGVKLGISDGFLAYQWQQDGVTIPGATGSKLVATQPGVYRGRFSRISATPATEADWNQWSKPVVVKESNAVTPVITTTTSTHFPTINAAPTVQINGPTQGSLIKNWYKNGVLLTDTTKSIVRSASDAGKYTLITKSYDGCPSIESNAIYVTSNTPLTVNLPTNLHGQVTSASSIQLFWNDNSSNESGFEIYRVATNPAGAYTYLGLLPEDAISFQDTGLQPSVTYYYKLRAVSPTAKSDFTSGYQITTIVDTTPPSAPQNLDTVALGVDVASVKLKWDAATDNAGVKEYVIFNGATQLFVTGNANTSFTVTGLTPNSNYAFIVKAKDFSGNLSQSSNQLNVATTFKGLHYEYSEGGKETLAAFDWNKAEFTGHVPNFTLDPKTQVDYFFFKFRGYLSVATGGNYKFRLSSDDGSAFYLGTAGQAYSEGASGVFNASNLSQNQIAVRDGLFGCNDRIASDSSSVKVLASNSFYPFTTIYFEFTGGECLVVEYKGPDTNNAWIPIPTGRLTSGSTPALPPAPGIPIGLSATTPAPTMTSISLNWNAVAATPTPQYQVYRSVDNTTFTIVTTTSATSYTDTNLLPGKLYYYKLRSTNVNGTSGFSSVASNTTTADVIAPLAPTGVIVAGKTYTNVALQWTASTDNVGVTGYKVFAGSTQIGTTEYTTFTASDLLPATLYSFTVKAFDANGNDSPASTAVAVTTDPPQVFYSKTSGDLTLLSNWGTALDGTGTAPASFASNGQFFKITRSATISTVWNIGGSTSRVLVDDNVALTIASTGQINGKIALGNNATLDNASPILPELENLSPTSTVIFNIYDVNNSVPATRYGNLTLNGTGLKKVTGTTLEVLGNLTLSNGVGITGLAGNGTTIQIAGNFITGATVPAASNDGRVSLLFTDNLAHSITTGSNLFFHMLTANTGATITFDDASTTNPITLTLGSFNSDGGLQLGTNSVLDIKNNTLAFTGEASINPTNTTGKIAVDHGSIQLTTTSSQNSNLYFATGANHIENFTLEATGAGRAIVQEALNVYNGLTINSGILESTTAAIRIKSSATASASIREIKNGGSIVGDVIVERYLPGKAGYRYLSTPVAGAKVVDWQASGIAINGNFTGANNTGTASLYWYNELTGGYKAFPSAGASSDAQFVKGRGYSSNILDGGIKTIVTTGNPFQGNVDFTLTAGTGSNANGWNLIGNPYASDVIWNTAGWNATNVGNVVYVRENNVNGTYQWKTWDRSTGTGTLENGKIPAGQAFWVQTAAAPALTVKENAKTTEAASNNTEIYRTSTPEAPNNFLSIELDNGTNQDYAYVKFTEDGIDGYNKLVDGVKMLNTNLNLSTASADGIALTVNDLSNAFCEKSISINLANVAQGNYTIRFNTIENFDIAQVQLVDTYLSKVVTLNDANTEYQITVNGDVASYKNRLALKLTRPDVTTSYALYTAKAALCNTGDVATITLANSQVGVEYEALNATSAVLSEKVVGTGSSLQLTFPASLLVKGENKIKVSASYPGGCAPALLNNTAIVTKSEIPSVTVTTPFTYACIGSEVKLSVEGTGSSYKWYDVENNKTLPGTGNTLTVVDVANDRKFYSVSAVNELGCESESKTMVVLADAPTLPTVTFEDGVLQTNVETGNIQWFLNGNVIEGVNSPSYTPTLEGKYTVRNYGEYCSKDSEPFEYLVTGIINGEKQFTMRAYPNPSKTGSVNIIGTSSNREGVDCRVVDMLGKIIFSKTIAYDEYVKGAPLTDRLQSGLYIIITNQSNTKLQQKLLVH